MIENFNLSLKSTDTIQKMVYKKLFYAIAMGYFKPGQRLVERKLAQEMNVSKTPVREAIRQLENEGLVKAEPYKGVMVKKLSPKEAYEIYRIRKELEGLAAELAADRVREGDMASELAALEENTRAYAAAASEEAILEVNRLNYEFHRLIRDMTGSDLLKRILKGLQASVSLLISVTMFSDVPGAVTEHQKVFEAIKDGDGRRANELMTRHICDKWKTVSKWIKG